MVNPHGSNKNHIFTFHNPKKKKKVCFDEKNPWVPVRHATRLCPAMPASGSRETCTSQPNSSMMARIRSPPWPTMPPPGDEKKHDEKPVEWKSEGFFLADFCLTVQKKILRDEKMFSRLFGGVLRLKISMLKFLK